MDLNDPAAVALLAASDLGRAGIDHALYGGLLLAAYGTARETRDADVAVAGATTRAAARALAGSGLGIAIAFERTRFGGLWVSRISLTGGQDPPTRSTSSSREARPTRGVRSRRRCATRRSVS